MTASASPILLQEELFSTTLHELRTPVSSINGYASILLSGELGKVDPKQRESLGRIQELCRSVTTLIGNLLTLAKTGSPRAAIRREFLSVGPMVRDLVRSLQGEVQRKKLKLATHLPEKEIRFWADPGELTQVFLNLISNAVKFTPKGGRVEVNLQNRPGQLVAEVADTGVGIPPGEVSRIFEEFYHVDHPEIGAAPGSGLGLAIVKRVVEAYHGEITVTSRVDHGSRFRVILPVRSDAQILKEFLEEIWEEARQSGRWTGLFLCQLKIKGRARERFSSENGSRQGPLEVLEDLLRAYLRKEDRVFHLANNSLLAVVALIDPEGFHTITKRLEEAFGEATPLKKFLASRSFQWRLTAKLSPRRGGSPAEFLLEAQKQLEKTDWMSGGGA